MNWKTRKKLYDSLYWDICFILFICNQTHNVSEMLVNSLWYTYPTLHPLLPLPNLLVTDLFTLFTILPFQESHRVGIIWSCSSWLLSLSNMHFRFLHIFSWLDNSFFLLLNSIPLSGCSTIYLSIYLLKDISSASKFWQLWTKCL